MLEYYRFYVIFYFFEKSDKIYVIRYAKNPKDKTNKLENIKQQEMTPSYLIVTSK